MTDSAKVIELLNRLEETYTERHSLLCYSTPFELMVAVSLSAQTTDAAVNTVTPKLFLRWPTASKLATADFRELEKVIHSLGFFRQKSRNLIAASQVIVERFYGKIPQAMDDLISLPGIGRKSANVIRSHLWNYPAIIVDTHFGRVCRRLGITEHKNPVKMECQLQSIVPIHRQSVFSMTANLHGRRICMARKPKCEECIVHDMCPRVGVE